MQRTWGLFTSVQEVKEVVSKKPSDLKTYLRQEIQYQRVTHQRDAEARKDLYKINKMSKNDMIETLVCFLKMI